MERGRAAAPPVCTLLGDLQGLGPRAEPPADLRYLPEHSSCPVEFYDTSPIIIFHYDLKIVVLLGAISIQKFSFNLPEQLEFKPAGCILV